MARIDTIDRRTDVVFLLFGYAEEIHGVTKLQKLLFLIEQETEFFGEYQESVKFEFAPYKMGPFSEHVYEELEFLLGLDAIQSEPLNRSETVFSDLDLVDKRFRITEKGKKIAIQLENQLEPDYQRELETLVSNYNDLSLRKLLQYVYAEYPEYAAESEIIDDLELEEPIH